MCSVNCVDLAQNPRHLPWLCVNLAYKLVTREVQSMLESDVCCALCLSVWGWEEGGGLHQNHLERFFISAVHPVPFSWAYQHGGGEGWVLTGQRTIED